MLITHWDLPLATVYGIDATLHMNISEGDRNLLRIIAGISHVSVIMLTRHCETLDHIR